MGTPLSPEGILVALLKKTDNFDLMISRFQLIHPHQAFVLLKNCFSIPKMQYIFRNSPIFKDPLSLQNFDEKLINGLAPLLNIPFNEFSWTQANLPVSV